MHAQKHNIIMGKILSIIGRSLITTKVVLFVGVGVGVCVCVTESAEVLLVGKARVHGALPENENPGADLEILGRGFLTIAVVF